ncbi:hypothetical protein BD414DRAFT_322911 [Trametes punicea]|nr:hypothetical protein BD414DRAFT_322911 [Trametes punicea]
MTRSAVLTMKTTNARKRKSTGGINDGKATGDSTNKRRRTIDTFFSPQVTLVSKTAHELTASCEHVTLNAEQVQVLRMVVHEEKSVFFTGAAGESSSFALPATLGARAEYVPWVAF